MKTVLCLICLLFTASSISADNYTFDADEFEKKAFEISGMLRLKPDLMNVNRSARLNSTVFTGEELRDFKDQYTALLQIRSSYKLSKLKFYSDVKNLLKYSGSNELENTLKIFEANLNIDFSDSFSVKAGKTSVRWGKGYVWNPVSFASRPKDITNTEEGLEGFWMIKADYNKALKGLIKNFSLTYILLPEQSWINSDFKSRRGLNSILKGYFLLKNTDIDIYLFMEGEKLYKLGADFSGSILENWEVHGEWVLNRETENSHQYLLGTRVLFPTDTTLILEYIHNGKGLMQSASDEFYYNFDQFLAGADYLRSDITAFKNKYLNSQFSMTDYLFLKVMQPEPFNILYLNTALYTLYNINDKSSMTGGELIYKRLKNIELRLRFNFMSGAQGTEFKEKLNDYKISFLMEYFF